jgi:hypothetical protein
MTDAEIIELARSTNAYFGVGYVARGEVLFREKDLLQFAAEIRKAALEEVLSKSGEDDFGEMMILASDIKEMIESKP